MMKSAEIVLLIMVPIIVIVSTKIKRTKSKNCSRKSMSAQTAAKKMTSKHDRSGFDILMKALAYLMISDV